MIIDKETGGAHYIYMPEERAYHVWWGSPLRLPGTNFVTCANLREVLDTLTQWCVMAAKQYQEKEAK